MSLFLISESFFEKRVPYIVFFPEKTNPNHGSGILKVYNALSLHKDPGSPPVRRQIRRGPLCGPKGGFYFFRFSVHLLYLNIK